MIKKTATLKFSDEDETKLIPYTMEDGVLTLFPSEDAESGDVMVVTLTEDEWEQES